MRKHIKIIIYLLVFCVVTLNFNNFSSAKEVTGQKIYNTYDDSVHLEKNYIKKLFKRDVDISGKYKNDEYYILDGNDLNKKGQSLRAMEIKNNEVNLEEGLWGLDKIKYNALFDAVNEFGTVTDEVYKNLGDIKVAILDSGIDYSHPDLSENIVEGYNFINNTEYAQDDFGHGTKIAGCIGGKYTGVAFGAKIMPVKILDKNGFGKTEDLVRGIIWAVDNGADIINLSIGRRKYKLTFGENTYDTFNELERLAIEYALINNVTVITVAGNFNEDEITYPAAYLYKKSQPSQIVVSAINKNEELALLANHGDKVDVVAPGEFILSTFPKGLDSGDIDNNIENDGYVFCDGTSYAGAYVSGLAALIKSWNSTLSNSQIKEVITCSAFDIGEPGKDAYYGYGIVDFSKCFSIPRINIFDNYNEFEFGDDVTYEAQIADAFGENLESVANSVYLKSKNIINIPKVSWNELISFQLYEYLDSIDTYVMKDYSVIDSVYGHLKDTLEIEDVGLYEGVLSTQKFVKNSFKYKIKPKPVVSSKQEDMVYTDGISIELSSSTPSANIYYTLGDTPIIVEGEVNKLAAKKYSGSIYLNSSTRINTIAVKNKVYSDISSFNYIIKKESNYSIDRRSDNSGTVSRGTDKQISKNKDDIYITEERLINSLDNPVMIYNCESTDITNIHIEKRVLEKVVSKQKGLIIRTEDVEINFMIDQLKFLVNYDSITIKISKTDKFSSLSPYLEYEISIKSGDTLINGNNLGDIFFRLNEIEDRSSLAVLWENENQGFDNIIKNFFVEDYICVPYVGGSTYIVVELKNKFKDIDDSITSRSVNFLWLRNIISGFNEYEYGPNKMLTRAQFASILGRYTKVNEKAGDFIIPFEDISVGDWYYDDLMKLYKIGIIKGKSDKNMCPNENLNKQDMIILLVKMYRNYFDPKDIQFDVTDVKLSYKDKEEISQYALDYVKSAIEIGLISNNDDMFNPKQSVTRANAAEILYEYVWKTLHLNYIGYAMFIAYHLKNKNSILSLS